jgi:hypothetical protein
MTCGFLATTGNLLNFLLEAEIEIIAAVVYPLWYRSIDLSTDPGLKYHLIILPSSE